MTAPLPPAVLSLLSLSHTPTIHSPTNTTVYPPPIDHNPTARQGHKRRLSSTGQTRRRLSDARDAAARPSLHSLASSAAALSISSSSPPNPDITSKSVPSDSVVATAATSPKPEPETQAGPSGKKKALFKCESCSKVYRHPTCLVKHRWEHSPHWRESSKLPLSKHQQVQMLEAAAILSHLSPSTSLPDDRSLWPTYVSGGLTRPITTVASSVPNDSTIDTKTNERSLAQSDGVTAGRADQDAADAERDEDGELAFDLEMDEEPATSNNKPSNSATATAPTPNAPTTPAAPTHPRINGFANPMHATEGVPTPMHAVPIMGMPTALQPRDLAATLPLMPAYPIYPGMVFVPVPIPVPATAAAAAAAVAAANSGMAVPPPVQIPRGRPPTAGASAPQTGAFAPGHYRDSSLAASSYTSSSVGVTSPRDANISQSFTSSSYSSPPYSPFSSLSRHSHSRSFSRTSLDGVPKFDHSRSFERGGQDIGSDEQSDDEMDHPSKRVERRPDDDGESGDEPLADANEWNSMEMEMEFAE